MARAASALPWARWISSQQALRSLKTCTLYNRKAGATGAARAVVICENHASRWLQPGSHPRVDHRVAAGFICWA